MTSTPTAPGVIRQADVRHEPSCMGNGLLNHDPAAVAWIRRAVMKAVRQGARATPCDRRHTDALTKVLTTRLGNLRTLVKPAGHRLCKMG